MAVHGLHEPDPAGGTQQGRDLTEGEVPDPDRDSFGEGCSLKAAYILSAEPKYTVRALRETPPTHFFST